MELHNVEVIDGKYINTSKYNGSIKFENLPVPLEPFSRFQINYILKLNSIFSNYDDETKDLRISKINLENKKLLLINETDQLLMENFNYEVVIENQLFEPLDNSNSNETITVDSDIEDIYKLFNLSDDSLKITNEIKIELSEEKPFQIYGFECLDDYFPLNGWKIEGSLDGANYRFLDTVELFIPTEKDGQKNLKYFFILPMKEDIKYIKIIFNACNNDIYLKNIFLFDEKVNSNIITDFSVKDAFILDDEIVQHAELLDTKISKPILNINDGFFKVEKIYSGSNFSEIFYIFNDLNHIISMELVLEMEQL